SARDDRRWTRQEDASVWRAHAAFIVAIAGTDHLGFARHHTHVTAKARTTVGRFDIRPGLNEHLQKAFLHGTLIDFAAGGNDDQVDVRVHLVATHKGGTDH